MTKRVKYDHINRYIGKYKAIPLNLIEKGLSLVEVVLYGLLADEYTFYCKVMRTKGYYKPSISSKKEGGDCLIKTLATSRSTVSNALNKLCELGYVRKISEKRGCAAVLHVNPYDHKGDPVEVIPYLEDGLLDHIKQGAYDIVVASIPKNAISIEAWLLKSKDEAALIKYRKGVEYERLINNVEQPPNSMSVDDAMSLALDRSNDDTNLH